MNRNTCWHCGQDTVIWGGDFMYSEVYGEGNGIVHNLHCSSCNSQIEYISGHTEDDEDEDDLD